MSFAPEPAYRHGDPSRTAVLLCNLGTPDAPTPAAVRRYLAEFLSDRRVVEIPRLLWLMILHGVILRTRPAKSARKYASIWTPEGSPLKVWTEKQAKLLRGYLGQRGHTVTVHYAMRYGNPSIASVMDELKAQGATRVLVLPLYPQYSATTTASVGDAVYAWAQQARHVPELRFVNRYHDDAGYIAALAKRVEDHWMSHGRPDKLLLSFHGVPRRTLALGDPYHCECLKTARLLGERLALRKDDMVVTFQSRLGRAEWLQPYTEPTLIALAQQGVKRVDVLCPGFTSDCLETLEEIDQEGRAAFLKAGGAEFNYLPCLNDQHEWIAALSAIAIQHMQGWPTTVADDPEAREKQRQRALAAGAAA
ncbi:ferrochelatase [Rhizobacter sp. Root404]|uniref:ferrochelatase n=1 Tax=Rhizobacter sp. Root404 TaxID=1736528 RepID=UPI0006F642A3|nr:ferrochelatase [Rhizobacter sp. Root404]KQW36445.1 ferrochelatase [Rhizobacter sp. Root404]